MSNKKKAKDVAHATMVWEREQLKAATMQEQLDKSLAIIEEHKNELTDEELKNVHEQVLERRHDIEVFILNAKLKYVNKLAEYGLEPTLTKE